MCNLCYYLVGLHLSHYLSIRCPSTASPSTSFLTDRTETQVIQTPRYLIIETGKNKMMTCFQNMSYDTMYWYRQDPGLGLKLIYFSLNVGVTEKGEVSDGYSIYRKDKQNFFLTVEKARTSQTSVYLCAGSTSTAPCSQLLSAQKG